MADNTSFAERFAKKKPISDSSGAEFDSEASNADKYKSKNSLARLLENNQSQAANSADANSSVDSAVDPIKASQADLIYLVKGVDDNRNAWYYVLVERVKLQLFLKALNAEIIHLENYGKIIHSAYGDEPPQEITDSLKKEYGIK